MERPEDRLAIKALHLADILYARIFHHMTVVSPCMIPRTGPAILVSNHIGTIDPACLQAACHQRLITWMIAKEYQDIKGMGWLFNTVGIIPVDRNGRDTSSLRGALRALQAGRVLGVFPEGRFSPTHELLPFQTGIAMMAIKSNVPVFPAYIDGNYRNQDMLQSCVGRNDIRVAYGRPVEFDRSGTSHENLEAATAAIKLAVERLANKRVTFASAK